MLRYKVLNKRSCRWECFALIMELVSFCISSNHSCFLSVVKVLKLKLAHMILFDRGIVSIEDLRLLTI